MEIENRMLNIFKNVSGGEWSLFTLEAKGNLPIEKTSTTDNYPLHISEELAQRFRMGEIYEMVNSPYMIQMIPISNYKGEYKSYFKRVFDNSELIDLQSEYTRESTMYGLTVAFFGVVIIWIVMSYLLSPLSYLEQKVRKLELGILVEPIKARSNDEIGYLAGAMENMRQSLYKRSNLYF